MFLVEIKVKTKWISYRMFWIDTTPRIYFLRKKDPLGPWDPTRPLEGEIACMGDKLSTELL